MLFEETVGGADEEGAFVVLLEWGEEVEILDVEGHGHEVGCGE